MLLTFSYGFNVLNVNENFKTRPASDLFDQVKCIPLRCNDISVNDRDKMLGEFASLQVNFRTLNKSFLCLGKTTKKQKRTYAWCVCVCV